MKYFYKKPKVYSPTFGQVFRCDGEFFNEGTLYLINDAGLIVIQQHFNKTTKHIWWGSIDPWIANDIYINPGFIEFFNAHADFMDEGMYPVVTLRQIMWALRMKPLKKENWEK